MGCLLWTRQVNVTTLHRILLDEAVFIQIHCQQPFLSFHFTHCNINVSLCLSKCRQCNIRSIDEQTQIAYYTRISTMPFSYLFNFSVPYMKTPQCVAGVHFGAFQRHHNVSILLTVLHRPVLVTFPLEGHNRHNESFTTSEKSVISVRDLFPFVFLRMIPVNLLCLFPPGWWSWWWFQRSAPKSSSKSPQMWTWEAPGQLYKLWADCSPETGEWWNIFAGKTQSILYKFPTTPDIADMMVTDARHWLVMKSTPSADRNCKIIIY